MKILTTFSFIIASFWTSVVLAATPCVKEVCVGDGLDKLNDIPWIAKGGTWRNMNLELQSSSEQEIASMKQIFGGDVAPAAQYLKFREFNALALSKLKNVNIACEYTVLSGRYETATGNLTEVKIMLLPIEQNSSFQQWRVIQITRYLNNIASKDQALDAIIQIKERYKEFLPNPSRKFNPGDALISINARYMDEPNPSIDFSLSYVLPEDIQQKLKKNAFCGGLKKVELD